MTSSTATGSWQLAALSTYNLKDHQERLSDYTVMLDI